MYNQKEKNYYWGEKDKFAQKAKEHIEEMATRFPDAIAASVKNTKVYNETRVFQNAYCALYDTEIAVVDTTSENAVADIYAEYSGIVDEKHGPDIAVLNFASYKFPGGGFLSGSKAQEECLCHASTLFNVISDKKFNFYYDMNKESLNNALYKDRALYSPGIIFNDKYSAAVVTCAAPNYTTALKYCKVSKERNTEALKSRIKYVLSVMADNNAQYLILGAYGCGVFGQEPAEVASIFKELLNGEFKDIFKKVIFAVPKNNRNQNYEEFKRVFESPRWVFTDTIEANGCAVKEYVSDDGLLCKQVFDDGVEEVFPLAEPYKFNN